MKKIIGILIISLAFLASCDKTDRNEPLYAVWIGVNESRFDCENQNNNYSRQLRCEDNSCYRLEIKSDGTFAFQQVSGVEEGRWTATGELLILCQDDDGDEVCEEYIIDSNTSTTLALSTINTANSCRTTFSYQRQEVIDALNGGN